MPSEPTATAATEVALHEDLVRAFDRMLAVPAPLPSSDGSTVNVRKVSAVVQISTDMAMDYGLMPDDRPPFVATRRQRFRWWCHEHLRRARVRLASWIAGFDVEDRW